MSSYLYGLDYSSFVGSRKGYCAFRNHLRLKKFTKIVDPQKDEKILEVGCNKGLFVKHLSQYSKNIYGIDINHSQIKKINKPNIKHMSATDIRFPRLFFDKVCSFEVIEHLPDPHQFFNQVTKVLKREGRLIISFPHEVIRGQTALLDSIFVYGDLKHARLLHLHKFTPKKIKKIIERHDLTIISSKLLLAPFPTYLMVFKKT